MKNFYLVILIIILLSFSCSRTLFLNQKADILTYKQKESTFVSSLEGLILGDVFTTFYTPVFINICPGFQQRFGISRQERVEYYFTLCSNLTFSHLWPVFVYGDINYDNGFKFLLYTNKQKLPPHQVDLSLILHWSSGLGFSIYPITYIQTIGLKLLGNYGAFYYGFPVRFNLMSPFGELTIAIEGGFVLGGEYIKNNIVVRNEFGLSIIYDFYSIFLSFGYGISVGKRYY